MKEAGDDINVVLRASQIAHNILRVIDTQDKTYVLHCIDATIELIVLMKEAVKKMEE